VRVPVLRSTVGEALVIGEAAKAWHDAGASVLPAMRGKRPTREWREFQTERATPYGTDWSLHDGFGIVTAGGMRGR
jgi:hypothetical protein